jgi:2,4-dienoyl-CoA reductase-like NADH-dependent reductase (Old Yellow Enzyme family)
MDPRTASLFQPLPVRNLTLKNRIVMAPMTRQFSPGGIPGADVAGYYRRRAEGEVGLIITEGTGVDHPAATDTARIPVLTEHSLAGWTNVVREVHAAGGLIFPQLWHQGAMRDVRGGNNPNVPAMRPSGIFGPIGVHTLDPAFLESAAAPTRPMTDSEIADVISAFGRSAGIAKRAGFDGIAIHGAHGYLIDGFLWHGTNTRTDRWGGDHTARTAFAVEIVKAIRAAAGPDMPLMFRFSQHKSQDYKARLGETPQELGKVLGPISDAGVDIFDGSERNFDKATFAGSELNLGGWAKKLTGKIGVTVGGIGLANELHESLAPGAVTKLRDNIPALLDRFARGEFDLVGVGRAVLSDPNWPRKLKAGEAFLPFERDHFMRLT